MKRAYVPNSTVTSFLTDCAHAESADLNVEMCFLYSRDRYKDRQTAGRRLYIDRQTDR